MVGKSGAARIALATGAPVIPIGQWGAQELLAPYAKKPDLFPRKLITMKVGDPVDLADLAGEQTDPAAVNRRPSGSWPPSPSWSRRCAARPRRPSGSTRAPPASAEFGNPTRATDARGKDVA